jgi:hypothetical protein
MAVLRTMNWHRDKPCDLSISTGAAYSAFVDNRIPQEPLASLERHP